ncbi:STAPHYLOLYTIC protease PREPROENZYME LASA [hydrothermal vent metagenome]|uniref:STAPHYLOLYTIC protease PREPROENZYME LASA n=1 Tax=hydrothermal vent metagenome TaxID=652676 RepID=A0A1W1C5P3_9ZZZZ
MLLNRRDLMELRVAKSILENPGFAIQVANYIGRPIEFAIDKIDSDMLNKATEVALRKSLDIAIGTIDIQHAKASSNIMHKLMVGTSGAIGGFFGMPSLPIELPISTTIMLRSIADIAQSQHHNLNDIDVRLACLEVFALGSTTNRSDDAGESAYFAARGALAYEMRLALHAVEGLSQRAIQEALAKGNLPILIKLINTIASRFGITVSEKLVAQTVPVIGSAGGAAINLLFINHFQNMAKGHFIVKRLERRYGADSVRSIYRKL